MAALSLTAGNEARPARIKGADDWLYLLALAENGPPERLAGLMNSLGDEPSAATVLGRRWAQQDPAGMLAYLKSHALSKNGRPPTGSSRDRDQQDQNQRQLQRILAQEWLRKDPEGLIAALSGIGPNPDLRFVKLETVRLLVNTDPGRTVDLMLAWDLALDSANAVALTSWVQAHPRQTAELLFLRDNGQRAWDDRDTPLLSETIKAMAVSDPAWALQIPRPQTGPLLYLYVAFSEGVLKQWAQRDLHAAAAFLADSHNGLSRQRKYELSPSLLDIWGSKDPAAALDWANTQFGKGASGVPASLLNSLAATDSAQALRFMDRLPPGRAKDEIFGNVVQTILEKSDKPQAAAMLQWMTALPDPIQRDTALKAGAGALMKTAPDEFLAWLKTPEGSTQAAFAVLQETARSLSRDNAKALEWTAGLRPEAAPLIRKDLIERWFRGDLAATTAWIRKQPAGDARADSITAATTYLSQQDSAGRLHEWLDSLPAADAPAIVEGIQKSSIPDPKQKAELLAKYGK